MSHAEVQAESPPANGAARPCLSRPKRKPSPALSASPRSRTHQRASPWSKAAIRQLHNRHSPRPADLRVRRYAVSPFSLCRLSASARRLQRRRCKTAIRTAPAASTARLIHPPAHAAKIGDVQYVIPISRDYCTGDDGTPPAH